MCMNLLRWNIYHSGSLKKGTISNHIRSAMMFRIYYNHKLSYFHLNTMTKIR
jgi:hypothetical protein